MARPMPPVSPYVPWPCSGTSTPTDLALATMTRLVALRSTTLTASSTIPTGSTTCSSPPPWEVINYEPRNPIESVIFNLPPSTTSLRHLGHVRHTETVIGDKGVVIELCARFGIDDGHL